MPRGFASITATARPRAAVWLWLACVAVAIWVVARSSYLADLSAFLPSSPTPEQSVLLDQLSSGANARVMLIGIEGGEPQARIDASVGLARALRASGEFQFVHNGDASEWQEAARFLFEHRYLLSPAVNAERFTVDGLRAGIEETISLLGTPAGAMVKPVILRDPTGESVRLAEAAMPVNAPRNEGGVWVSRLAPRALLLASTRAHGSDLDGQQRAIERVRSTFAAQAQPGLTLQLSGPGVLSVSSRAQIQSEAERLAVAGGLAIGVLLWLAFGSMRVLGTALLPVASGVLAGIAAVSLGFGHVHGLTLAFGTTLIGEAVDYAIYYLIQVRKASSAEGGATAWMRENWPTVRLGLGTSLCGFAALVFSGFPGLAQLGVFSVAGLTAAALTTRYVFPALAPAGAPGEGSRRQLARLTARAVAVLRRARRAFYAVTVIALAALWLLPSPWRGELASLSPVSATALELDAALRADIGAAEAGVLVAVSASDEASALALAEAAGERLDRLVSQGVLQGYDSPARLLPSPGAQGTRRDALPDAATLRQRLAEATAHGRLKAERLGAFIDDVQAARAQRAIDRAALEGTPLANAIDGLLMPGQAGKPWRALLTLHAAPPGVDSNKVRAALADLPAARVVDIKPELDALYARYLREAMLQASVGALAVCALLAARLRSARALGRVILPIAASVAIVVAALAGAGAALGILHLVGVLLVVAIGSNYALFFEHLRSRGSANDDTLASLALANLTTVVSFGLLAASSIPPLAAIGLVVAPGALLCLVLAAAFIEPAMT